MCNQATRRKTSVWERKPSRFWPRGGTDVPPTPPALQGRRNTHRHDAVGDGLLEGILHRFLQLGQQHGSDLFNAERLLLLHVHHLRFAAQKRRTGQARVQTRTKIQSADVTFYGHSERQYLRNVKICCKTGAITEGKQEANYNLNKTTPLRFV